MQKWNWNIELLHVLQKKFSILIISLLDQVWSSSVLVELEYLGNLDMVKTIINQVESNNDICLVEMLAKKIWNEHYPAIIGREQVNYMLGKYQTTPAIKRQIEDGANYHLVYEQDHPVGYFCYHYENDSLFLSKIYVAKEVRGHGIGKRALDFIVEQAKLKSAKAIRLTVNKFNSATIAVYKQLGFQTIDSVVKDIGGGFVMDDYVMEKPLIEKAV